MGSPTTPQSRTELGVLGLGAFLLAWDLWAIFVDQRITLGLDCHTHHAVMVLNGEMEWPSIAHSKNPLVTLLSLLMITVLGKAQLATRLISVLCHVVLVAQSYDLGRRVGRSPAAGLWSALMAGTFPMVVGWARLDFPDFVVVCPILAALQLLVRLERLERLRQAVLLGLLLGLGVMTKLSFVLYLVGPGLFLVITRVRGRRGALWVGVALGVLLLVIAPWAALNLGQIGMLMVQSASDSGETILQKARVYFSLPGVPGMIPAAILAGLYLLVRRTADRWQVGLLLTYIIAALVLLVLVFDSASRYSVALFPVTAVLVGAGLPHLLARVGPARGWVAAALAASLLGVFVWLNFGAPEDPRHNRELSAGMLTPDRRDHTALEIALAEARRHGPELLLVVDNDYTNENLTVPLAVLRLHGRAPALLELAQARQLLAEGRSVPVLLASFEGEMKLQADRLESYFSPRRRPTDGPTPPPLVPEMKERFLWAAKHDSPRRLTVLEDGYGIVLALYLLR